MSSIGPILNGIELNVMIKDLNRVKQEGNSLYAAGSLAAAVKAYTDALGGSQHLLFSDFTIWLAEEESVQQVLDLIAMLFNNRAAANLQLGNYKQVIIDTSITLFNCTLPERVPGIDLPIWMDIFRSSPKVADIYLKARWRRAQAFEYIGNTAKASEELHVLSMINRVVFTEDCKAKLKYLQAIRHPDTSPRKVDWSLSVAGFWRKLDTGSSGPCARQFPGCAFHNNQLYVYHGENTSYTKHSDMWRLDLTSLRWSKITPPSTAARPPEGHQPPVMVHNNCLYVYHGGATMYKFDLQKEKWSKIPTIWPSQCREKSSPKYVVFSDPHAFDRGGFDNYAATSDASHMYIFSGSTFAEDEYCLLVSYCFSTNRWEHLFSSNSFEKDFPRVPEPRAYARAWIHANRFYVFGGARHRPGSFLADTMLDERSLMWSFDLSARTWRNELSDVTPTMAATCIPASRGEYGAAQAGSKALIFGGYSTNVSCQHSPNFMRKFSYYADSAVYDGESGVWRQVVSNVAPPYRAGCVLVYVPDAPPPAAAAAGGGAAGTPSASGTGAEEAAAGAGAAAAGSSSRRALVPGRFLLFGGYHSQDHGYNDLWELRLETTPKRLRAMCHACGKFDTGMMPCGGSCNGSVVFCSRQCQKTLWDSHKQWCQKV